MSEDKAKEGVTQDGKSPEAVKVDDKGVPLENRVKEYERKLQDKEREVEELKSKLAAENAADEDSAPEPSEAELAEAKKQKILQFVDDPDAYIERKVQERELVHEIPKAESWIKSQPGFEPEDEKEIIRIIAENGLRQPSPMQRARAAWNIRKGEKLEREFAAANADKTRENSLGRTEGAGRATPSNTKPKRSELLAQLSVASKKGDRNREAAILDQLEDQRE